MSKISLQDRVGAVSETANSVCPLDCPDACALKVTRENGRITKVAGHPDHPVTRGAICHKVQRFPERTHDPARLLQPLRRKPGQTGRVGREAFEPISWEAAYALMAQRFRRIIEAFGSQAILPYSYYGNMGVLSAESMDRRFFNRLGACHLDRTICNAAAVEGFRYTMGAPAGVDPEDTVHARLLLIWGCNIVSTNMHQVMLANEARRKNGARIVVIDVHRNRTARWGDEFYQVRPGSDAALALGMMHVLMRDNLVDHAFVAAHTHGYAELVQAAAEYTPQRTAELTGLEVAAIEHLAHLYGTTSPALIRIGNGLQHHDNGGMIIRTLTCLPALTGQWGRRGGGALKGNGWYAQFNRAALERPDLHPDPGGRRVNMNQLGDALLDEQNPIAALFVYNANPAVVTPDLNRVKAGLLRDDLFTVVHDLFFTDTCAYADLVIPATSHFENLDLYKSYWHLYLQLSQPVIPVQGECKSNVTLFRELAQTMGFAEPCFDDTEEDLIRQALDTDSPYLSGITLERLKTEPWVRLNVPNTGLYPEQIPTPSGKIEFVSRRMAAAGLPDVPMHVPLQESAESSPWPFAFITAPNHRFLNSTCANDAKLQKLEGVQPCVQIHPDDARVNDVGDGDRVVVWNQRGEVRLQARITADVLPGTLVTLGLWWEDEARGLMPVNTLTSARSADMGGGATFFSVRVAIRFLRTPSTSSD